MEAFVLFLLKLAVYPVLLIGFALCASRLYKFLRDTSCLKVTTACKARVITGVLAVIALWSMSKGWPKTIDTVSGALSLTCYIACAWVGANQVWKTRDDTIGWLKDQFEME